MILLAMGSCSSGKQMILPQYEENLKLPVGTDDVKVITYNIKAVSEKPLQEIQNLIAYLSNQRFDIIHIQEVFSEQTRKRLVDSLTPYYQSIMERVDYGGWASLWQDAGLMIFSNYSTVNLGYLDFGIDIKNKGFYLHKLLDKQMSVTLDPLANKSIACMLLQKNESNFILSVNTHAQAIGTKNHKLKQLKEIRTFIERVVNNIIFEGIVKPEHLTVMLTGDFNIDANSEIEYKKLKEELGHPIDLSYKKESDKQESTFVAGLFNALFKFDYIFSWEQIGEHKLNALKPIIVNVSDVKVEGKSISDHYPVIGSFQF